MKPPTLACPAAFYGRGIGESRDGVNDNDGPDATDPGPNVAHFPQNGTEGRVERSGVSALWVKRWYGGGFNTALARLAQSLRRTITASPELFLPVACLFVWQVTATAVKPATLGLALLLTLLLFVYGYRVLGKTKWLCRIGWVSPRRGFWIYSFVAGVAAAAGIWSYVRIFHQSLGRVPPPHRVLLASASGPMIEEMLFRGILFWLILEFLRRRRMPRLAAVCATVLLTAILFALSHNDRNAATPVRDYPHRRFIWLDARTVRVHGGSRADARCLQFRPVVDRDASVVWPLLFRGGRTIRRLIFDARFNATFPGAGTRRDDLPDFYSRLTDTWPSTDMSILRDSFLGEKRQPVKILVPILTSSKHRRGYSGTRVDVSRNQQYSSRRDHQGAATLHETEQDTFTLVLLRMAAEEQCRPPSDVPLRWRIQDSGEFLNFTKKAGGRRIGSGLATPRRCVVIKLVISGSGQAAEVGFHGGVGTPRVACCDVPMIPR